MKPCRANYAAYDSALDVGLDHRALVTSVIVHDCSSFSGTSVHAQAVNTLMSDAPLGLHQSCTISDMTVVCTGGYILLSQLLFVSICNAVIAEEIHLVNSDCKFTYLASIKYL